MQLANFFQEMIILYLIGCIGFLAFKFKVFNTNTIDSLNRIVLNLTLPFLILHSLGQTYSMETVEKVYWLPLISVYIMFVAILLAFFLRKMLHLSHDRGKVFEGLIIFGNQGFIGFAILTVLFPEQGALYVSLFNMPYLVLIWTYGIYLFVGKKEGIPWNMIFLNPGIVATLAGMVLFILPFQLPYILSEVLYSVGSTTIPLSMLLIGALIANINFAIVYKLWKDKDLWIITGMRLIGVPLFLFPLIIFKLPFPLLATVILVTGTPAAPTMALFSQKYGGDTDFAAVGSAWTTILSSLSIPLLYLLLYLCHSL